ncbi:hypothetical protein [Christiangramia sediminis]|uniref:Uncharacterized protein n=1 Tax=Christiangramia sediminis TaxID=2881336 RepID=A0A9X1LKL0_9FLAO|nr:hypothetical protein [Christiangramia sediminis]MCB7482068.1 hypothetical protein [Christiangramia sediminis]
MKTWKNLMLIFLLFGLFSCSEDDLVDRGDDGPDPGPDPVAETQTGVFRDSEVAGLNYETETKSGVTDAEGKFEYLEGETVTFSLGDIILGSGPASEDMTPISIVSTENATVEIPEVKNIAAFLQSLDSDNDPSNGISISEETAAAITIDAIDFTQPIERILGEIVAEVNLATGSELEVVYPEEAAVHLAETTGDTYDPGVDVFKKFIPTLESWKPYPPTSVYWIHETNAEGELINSTLYEKYPERILYKIDYTELLESNLPASYVQTYYNYGEPGNKVSVQVNYNEDHTVAGFYRNNADGSFNQNLKFVLEDNNRVSEGLFYSENDEFWYRQVYEKFANGNTKVNTRYTSESGYDDSAVQRRNEYTYTEFGDIASETIDSKTDNFETYTWYYAYTNEKTLESKKSESVALNGRNQTWDIFYDSSERIERQVISAGDFVSDYVEFYPNGDPKRAETYYQGFLYEIVEWAEDGTSVWKTINEEDGSYKIEYKDENENILKTEYYDSDGNLISTE